MTTSCENCPLRPKECFDAFTAHELSFMSGFKAGEMQIEAGTPILAEGSNAPQLYTVLRGMGLRYKLLENGERQVINFVMPGDFLGLQAGVMGKMSHSVEATTAMTLCVFDRTNIWSFFKDSPERAFDITWLAAVEEHFLGETVLTLGQRDAEARIAWALLRFAQRGAALGLLKGGRMDLPFRQQDLADALGLSLVHTNKTLRKLRTRQAASWHDGTLHVPNLEALAKIAQTELTPVPTRPLI